MLEGYRTAKVMLLYNFGTKLHILALSVRPCALLRHQAFQQQPLRKRQTYFDALYDVGT